MQLDLARAPIDLAIFGRRLNADDDAPVTVGVSGGGDSMALLLIAKQWADRAGRRLLALTVDHGLQLQGAAWAASVAERAGRLGVAHRTLRWDGLKPSHGLPAAARAARHALLAQAARTAGARVILLGHTADDLMEAEVMRSFGSSVPSPRDWSPSPAWPEGRGVFLFRPLLGLRRAGLRDWLSSAGEQWIEDPANDDPRFARTLARRRLASMGAAAVSTIADRRAAAEVPAGLTVGECSEFTLPRAAFGDAAQGGAAHLLAALCLCASGSARPPRAAALGRLLAQLASGANFAAGLAGARIEATGEQVLVCREVGEFKRAGTYPALLPIGESVFDGRFAVVAAESGWSVRPLRGLAKRLPAAERARLAELPTAVRPGLPMVTAPGREPTCPILAQAGPDRGFSITRERLLAALGGLPDEASLRRVAKMHWGA